MVKLMAESCEGWVFCAGEFPDDSAAMKFLEDNEDWVIEWRGYWVEDSKEVCYG